MERSVTSRWSDEIKKRASTQIAWTIGKLESAGQSQRTLFVPSLSVPRYSRRFCIRKMMASNGFRNCGTDCWRAHKYSVPLHSVVAWRNEFPWYHVCKLYAHELEITVSHCRMISRFDKRLLLPWHDRSLSVETFFVPLASIFARVYICVCDAVIILGPREKTLITGDRRNSSDFELVFSSRSDLMLSQYCKNRDWEREEGGRQDAQSKSLLARFRVERCSERERERAISRSVSGLVLVRCQFREK